MTQTNPRLCAAAFVVIAIVYLICAYALALTRMPWYDEGQNANPSFDWIERGTTGISVVEPSGAPVASREPIELLRIQQRNYTEMPVYLVLLTAWFKVFGVGVLALRSFTIWCGLTSLLAWFLIVRKLTMDFLVTIVAGLLIAIDYGFALRVSEGRMDALSAALGFSGIAAYLYLREHHFTLAILVSQTFTALSGLTHPNGGLLTFAGLLFLITYYDFGRLRFFHLLIASVPYLLGAAAWGLYIAQDVAAFRAQFTANARFGGRLQTFSAPFENLKQEILQRYLISLGGWSAASSAAQKLKILIPLAYAAGLLGVLSTPALRKTRGSRVLLILTGLYFVVLAFTDGRKSQCYLIHIIPLFITLVAVFIVWLWREKKALRILTGASVTALVLLNIGGIAYQARQDPYHRIYLPTISYIKANIQPAQLIMGPGSLGIGLRYPGNLLDDIRLGMRSGKAPEWIVVDEWYSGCFAAMKSIEPDAYRFVEQRLKDYRPVYQNGSITILSRNRPG